MAESNRKLSDDLVRKLVKGEYRDLLEHIKSDKELRLEIRGNKKVSIYYNRNSILDIEDIKEAKDDPKAYFKKMKKRKPIKPELEIQQKIARDNSDFNSKYIILDMEYGPSQEGLDDDKRIHGKDGKTTRQPAFDLLGFEIATKDIILFEVKRGIHSLNKQSGIKDHLDDFKECFIEKKETYSKILKKYIEDVIEAKEKLGVLEFTEKDSIKNAKIKFMFIFAPSEDEKQQSEEKIYKDIYEEQVEKDERGTYPTIFVNSKDCDLSKGRLWPET